MKQILKGIVKPLLLVLVGVNTSNFIISSSFGMQEIALISVGSAVLCMIGYTQLASEEKD